MPDSIPVWWATLDQLAPRHHTWLDDVERARHERYRRTDDAARFALGAALLRAVAGAALAVAPVGVVVDRTCPTCGAPHGRPVVAGWSGSCSVAHSGRWVLVAADARSRVGVDVEVEPVPDVTGLLPQVLAPGEQHPDDVAGFRRLWARKEALLKASGEGLRRSMTTVRGDDARVVDVALPGLASTGSAALAVLDRPPGSWVATPSQADALLGGRRGG